MFPHAQPQSHNHKKTETQTNWQAYHQSHLIRDLGLRRRCVVTWWLVG
jgi:hypothetical protein